ncbi:hypothetical protein AAGW05_09470 [Arthrobacter sp. LAPM80]|uniref:hypothetical protein n=1 Tax=Arthrobacter sp. LAPM80 TaxID=3141788 RepID=UPI00398B7160
MGTVWVAVGLLVLALTLVDAFLTALAATRSYPREVVLVFVPVALLHIVGLGSFVIAIHPQHLQGGSSAVGVGVAVSAYIVGVNRAVDADRIAAIERTTRQLVDLKQPAAGVAWGPPWYALLCLPVIFASGMSPYGTPDSSVRVELMGLLNQKLGLRDPLTRWITGFDLENIGYLVVGALMLAWLGSRAFWKLGSVEERWARKDDSATVVGEGN